MELLISSLIAIVTVVAIEALLSVDNSVVISMIANKAKPEDRPKVVKYGIIGAFAFRGLSLGFISWLMLNPQIGGFAKLLGAIWLLKIGYELLTPAVDSIEEGEVPGWLEKLIKVLALPAFIGIILEVELADFIFSVDNLFAAIAMTENISGQILGMPASMVVCIIGVFLGILTMRFITVYVMKLIDRYPALNQSAAIVILLLGIKLFISGLLTITEPEAITHLGTFGTYLTGLAAIIQPAAPYLESHLADFIFSGLTVLIFLYPIIKANRVSPA